MYYFNKYTDSNKTYIYMYIQPVYWSVLQLAVIIL